MWPPQQILWLGLVEIKPCFLFTLHFLDINICSAGLRSRHGDPRFLSLLVFAFAKRGIIFLEVTHEAGVLTSCKRDCWMLMLRQWVGPSHPCAGVSHPPAAPVNGFLNSTSNPIFHFVMKSGPSGSLRGSFQPRGSLSVVSDQHSRVS